MKLHSPYPLYLLCTYLVFTGCTESPAAANADTELGVVAATNVENDEAEVPLVKLHTAQMGRLPLRRRTNGKLRARRRILVKSQTAGLLTVAPEEGRYYGKGAVLLATDARPLELALDRARAARDEAAYRRRDLLLRLSTNLPPGDSTSVTERAKENILQQSGLPAAEVGLREAEHQLSLASQAAPFGGRAADVKVQTGQLISPGEEVCTLVDLASLEVEFNLLEHEIADLSSGRSVYVSPLARPAARLRADLDIINPLVSEDGLLRARAKLRESGKGLYPGMNVTVTLEGRAPQAVLVPKTAVVERSGRELVFVYDTASEHAKWQYVTISHRNDEQVAISEGVMAGDQVIVEGNLTLDHDSPVRIAQQEPK